MMRYPDSAVNNYEKNIKVYELLNTMVLSGNYKKQIFCKNFPEENSIIINGRNRNKEYAYYQNYFYEIAPEWLKRHREYFNKNQRGFGEDAFHAMWFNLFRDFQPKNVLEIGVYRGQVISLWSLLAYNFGLITEVYGISPFNSAGDKVSKYDESIDYYSDVLENFKYFNLKIPHLHKGYSTDIEMVEVIQSKKWDIIYIDGNHDYEIVKKDYDVCSKSLSPKGLIVLDDSSLYTNYKPSSYSTAGHPGPSRLAKEINTKDFSEIIAVGHNRIFQKK